MNAFSEGGGARSERKRRTRAAVLRSARALFAERGFEGTTIRDVAARAGVAVGTVFLHCPDKGALLAATLDDQIERTLTRAWSSLPEGDVRRRLRHVVGALYRMYARSPALSRVLIKESLFSAGDEVSRARLDAFLRGVAGMLAASGELRTGADADVAARAVFAAYFAVLVEGLSAPAFGLEQQLGRFERMIDPWLEARPARKRKAGGRR